MRSPNLPRMGISALMLAMLPGTAALSLAAPFKHPGVLNTQEELDFIRTHANGAAAHPMKNGLAGLRGHRVAGLNYQVRPEATVQVAASSVSASEQNFRDAAHAAYAHALMWVATGLAAHRDKSLEVMNKWGATFQNMTRLSNRQESLEASWALPTWAAAAEIMRHYNKGAAGWVAADMAKFNNMLNILAGYSLVTIEPEKRTNNWATSAILAQMAVGVFQDDSVKFNKGMNYLNYLLPIQVERSGLLMETCRDCNHAEYNLLGLMAAAEVAWKQGIDFYGKKLDGQAVPRLLMGMEFHAAALLGRPLNVGQSCGARNCSGDDRKAPGWEIGNNHYRYRANIQAPNTVQFVTTVNRTDGLSEDHFTGWTTLTHGELGNVAQSSGLRLAQTSNRPRDETLLIMPMAGSGVLRFRLPYSTMSGTRMEVFSPQGRLLHASTREAGEDEVSIDEREARDVGNGPMLLRLSPAAASTAPGR